MKSLRKLLLAAGLGLLAYSTHSFAQEKRFDKFKKRAENVKDNLEQKASQKISDYYYHRKTGEFPEYSKSSPSPYYPKSKTEQLKEIAKDFYERGALHKVVIPFGGAIGLAIWLYTKDLKKRRKLERQIRSIYHQQFDDKNRSP